jgi:hypothetical protein
MVDLIVMIVMIVFLLGMATLAFITYDKAQKERGYLAALREIPARQKSELDTVKARYSELSTLVGLKGNADFTSEAEIERMLREGSRMMAEYYTVHAPGSEESKSIAGVDQNADSKKLVPRVDATGRVEYVEEPYKTIKVGGTNIVAERIYNPTEITTLQGGIARQDDVIHKLVTTEIPNINKQRVNQGVEKSKAAGERSRGAEAAYAATNQKIRTSEEDVGKLNSDSRDYETALAQAKEAEANTAVRLTAADLRADREAAYRTATEAAEAQNAAVDAQDAYRLQSDKRRMDDSRDPDGAVFLVDDTSGYVWINIGQKSGVQLEQTFQVVRPSANLSSETQIAEIRVKELLRGNVARCRVGRSGRSTSAGDPTPGRSGRTRRSGTWGSRPFIRLLDESLRFDARSKSRPYLLRPRTRFSTRPANTSGPTSSTFKERDSKAEMTSPAGPAGAAMIFRPGLDFRINRIASFKYSFHFSPARFPSGSFNNSNTTWSGKSR